MYMQWGNSPLYMRQISYRIWEWNKNIAPTIWGADWNYYGTADYVVITLDLSPYCIHETLIVTISKLGRKSLPQIFGTN